MKKLFNYEKYVIVVVTDEIARFRAKNRTNITMVVSRAENRSNINNDG